MSERYAMNVVSKSDSNVNHLVMCTFRSNIVNDDSR